MSEKEKIKKVSSVEKTAAKKPAAKKPAAKKPAAKKPAAKKPAAKKLSVKKNTSSSNDKAVYTPTLQSYYTSSVVSSMQKKFKYTNVMQVPKIVSINLNMGLGDAKSNSKNLESSLEEMSLISGQKPITTKAKKDISNFKIRKGWPVGCKVTLRSKMMYEFLDRLISVALPRTRDFRGLSFKSFDGRGNYNFGIKEQIIFTEIDYDKIQSINGLNVTITTSASSDNEAYELLKLFGLPLREKPKKNEVEEAA
jgi:large subunit ribosomal protein L5